jgi:hypothetical protein
MTYNDLAKKLGENTDKKIAHATTVRWGTNDGVISTPDGKQHEDQRKVLIVRFHATDILYLYPDGSVRVYAGGWRTHMTRERVREFGKIRIQSHEGLWFIDKGGHRKTVLTPFYDGMLFDASGLISLPREETYASVMKRKHALDRAVRRYIKDFNAALKKQVDENGEMLKPDGGNCWYCYLFGDPNVDHVLRHMEAGYFVPSLLFNAMVERRSGTSWQSGRPSKEEANKSAGLDWFLAESDFKHRDAPTSWFVDRALRAYLSKRKWRLLEIFDPVAFKKAYKDEHTEEA